MDIAVFSLVKGKGLVRYVVNIVVFSREIDMIIWAASLLFVASMYFRYFRIEKWPVKLAILIMIPLLFLLYFGFTYTILYLLVLDGSLLTVLILESSEKKLCMKRGKAILLILVFLLVMAIPIELVALVRWVMSAYVPGAPFSDTSWNVVFLETQLSSILNPWLPRLMLIFLVSWIFRVLSQYYWNELKEFVTRVLKWTRDVSSNSQSPWLIDHVEHSKLTRWSPKLILAFSVFLAVLMGLYPYSNVVNPSQLTVGVDAGFYQRILDDMVKSNLVGSVSKAFSDPRSITHLFHLFVAGFTSSSTALRFTPIILSILLALTTYLLVKVGTENENLAATSAFISVFSFHTTIGINAGFYANWLALSFVNIAFAFTLLAFKTKRKGVALISIISTVVVLYTHPWTWTVIMIVIGLYGLITIILSRLTRRIEYWELSFIMVLLAANFVADMSRRYLLQRGGAELTVSTLSPGFRLMDPSYVIGVLGFTFTSFLGGALANVLLILLAIIGFLAIKNYGGHFNRILLAWGIVASVGVFFFGSPGLATQFFQARSLYIVPFQIFAGLGILTIIRVSKSVLGESRVGNISINTLFNRLLFLVFSLAFMNYSLRVLSTLYPYVV